jgi:hypothetical protein
MSVGEKRSFLMNNIQIPVGTAYYDERIRLQFLPNDMIEEEYENRDKGE